MLTVEQKLERQIDELIKQNAALAAENETLSAKLAEMETELAELRAHKESAENRSMAWLANALEQYTSGDVITVPAGAGTEEEFFAWLKDQPDKPAARITEQDVQEIVYQFADFSSLALPRTEAINYLVSAEVRNLLNKLNADREQVPAADGESHSWNDQDKCEKCGDRDWYAEATCAGRPSVAVPDCFMKLYDHARGMRFGIDWNNGTAARNNRQPLIDATRECETWLSAQSNSQQSEPDWESEAKRAFWCGLEIGAGMGSVPILPRWDEYIAKRKGELFDRRPNHENTNQDTPKA